MDVEKARAEAEKMYPREHVGYKAKPPEKCSCDECYVHDQEREAYTSGLISGAFDQAGQDEAEIERLRDKAARWEALEDVVGETAEDTPEMLRGAIASARENARILGLRDAQAETTRLRQELWVLKAGISAIEGHQRWLEGKNEDERDRADAIEADCDAAEAKLQEIRAVAERSREDSLNWPGLWREIDDILDKDGESNGE